MDVVNVMWAPRSVRYRNRLGETLTVGAEPDSGRGFFWVRYHPGEIRQKRARSAMTPRERRAFMAKTDGSAWEGYDGVVAALIAAAVAGLDLAPLAAAIDRLEGGEVPNFDPRAQGLRRRRHWSRIIEILRSPAYEDRLRVRIRAT